MNGRASEIIRGFYGIVNVTPGGPDPVSAAREMIDAGCLVIQLRHKGAGPQDLLAESRALMELASRFGARLIIDDNPLVAAEAGADGVHVGQHDVSYAEARQVVGASALVGVSTHNLAQLRLAVAAGADYVGFGPVFGTRTKENPDPVLGLNGLRAAVAESAVPIVAIGGIGPANAAAVAATGVHALASIEAVYHGPGIGAAVRLMRGFFEPRVYN
jgi:thiamine-phosphate pyrophosphorylase